MKTTRKPSATPSVFNTVLALVALAIIIPIGAVFHQAFTFADIQPSAEKWVAKNPGKITQGDSIIFPSGETIKRLVEETEEEKVYEYIYPIQNKCTIGYVDKHNHTMTIAKHCVKPESSVVLNSSGETIAHITPADYGINDDDLTKGTLGTYTSKGDIVTIPLDEGVRVADNPNPYSGDKKASNPSVGNKICHYGQTTQEVKCGRILRVNDHSVRATTKLIQGGDSGGPVWIDGEGFVGVISGSNSTPDKDSGKARRLGLASYTRVDE